MKKHKIKLSKEDSEIFLNALKNPPEPNEALKALLKENKSLRQAVGSRKKDKIKFRVAFD